MSSVKIQKLQIISSMSTQCCPAYDAETEQRLTISDSGRVWFSAYNYHHMPLRKQQLSIGKSRAQEVITFVRQYLLLKELTPIVMDGDNWDITVTFESGEIYKESGTQDGTVRIHGIDLSEMIREMIPISNLIVFGENDKDDFENEYIDEVDEPDASPEYKTFWYVEHSSGNQMLVRPDGTHTLLRKKAPKMFETPQAAAGWQRAILYVQEYEIDEVMGFGCAMNTISAYVQKGQTGNRIAYLFLTPMCAERYGYSTLSETVVVQCRKNLEAFYSDFRLQIGWPEIILRPICLKVYEETLEPVPAAIASLGKDQSAISFSEHRNVSGLDQESLKDLFTSIY